MIVTVPEAQGPPGCALWWDSRRLNFSTGGSEHLTLSKQKAGSHVQGKMTVLTRLGPKMNGTVVHLWQLLMDHRKAIVLATLMKERMLLTTGYFHQLSGQIGFLLLQLQASCCFTANALDRNTRRHVSYLCAISLDIICTFWWETNAETQAVSRWLGSGQSHFKAESKRSLVLKNTTSTALPFAQVPQVNEAACCYYFSFF